MTAQQQLVVQKQQFSGPIPPPDALAQYERIHAGLADRIVSMAESQMNHRHALERMAVGGEGARADRGQVFALIVAICGLVVAALCAYWNQGTAASIIGGLDITGLAGVFIYGSRKKREELDKRSKTPGAPEKDESPS